MVVARSCQGEDGRPHKREPQRPSVGLPVVGIVFEEDGNTNAQRRHLRQGEAHEDDLPAHNVQPIVNQDPRQQEARDERP